MNNKLTTGFILILFSFFSLNISSCITAKSAPKSYGKETKTSKAQKKTLKKSKSQSVKKMKNAGKYNPKTDF